MKLARYGQSDIFASGVQMIGDKLRCQFDLTGAAAGVWDVVATNPDSESFTLTGGFVVVGTLWSENFDGSVSGWTSQATTGSNSWSWSPLRASLPQNRISPWVPPAKPPPT